MIVSKSIEFCAAHRVRTHDGACKHLHGHQYKVTLYVEEEVGADGMVRDFGMLSAVLRERVHDVFDHGTILDMDDDLAFAELLMGEDPDMRMRLVNGPPTAETLADWVLRTVRMDRRMAGVHVCQVDVWETPTSCATLVNNREATGA